MTDSMNVYWLEQTEADVPMANGWLSASELLCLSGLRFPQRRDSWRLGRWTAKCALAAYLDVPADPRVLAKIEIRPAPSGAPEAFVANKPAHLTISLSHRAGMAVCAIAPTIVKLGCDLETIEPRTDGFVADYFSADEQALIANESAGKRFRLLALLWSAKESALKALHEGLRLDTRSVIVSPDNGGSCDRNGWSPLQVHHIDGQVFHGWWQYDGGTVRTIVANPPPNPPIFLEVPACLPDRISRCA